MDGKDLGIPNVDLSKVKPLNQQRSVAFTNNFIARTACFLNRFAVVAEEDLAQQTLEMQKLEIALSIIEEKLASIPGLNEAYAKKADAEKTMESTPKDAQSNASTVQQSDNGVEPVQEPEIQNFVAVKDDPRYARFIKMMNVGVPVPAVEAKMKNEGLDPTLLHTPDAPLPDAAPAHHDEGSDSDSLSSMSFSDSD